MGNATMHDVAKLAGVSLATVGRVLHKNGYVSQENREKVEAAVKALGYIPNSAAQLLKNSCSRMLGHILHFSPNLLFGQISRGVDRAAAERGYSVLSFTKYGSPGEDQRIVTEFISRRVEGVLITSLQEFDQGLLDKLLDAGIPTVRIERAPPGADRVMVDDFQGAYQGARSLVEAGHKHIAFIGVGGDSRVERLRLLGYRKALEEGASAPRRGWSGWWRTTPPRRGTGPWRPCGGTRGPPPCSPGRTPWPAAHCSTSTRWGPGCRRTSPYWGTTTPWPPCWHRPWIRWAYRRRPWAGRQWICCSSESSGPWPPGSRERRSWSPRNW